MKNPRFSIITCTYNSSEYLLKNIDSVKSQIFDNFEHIFVDGFSSDDTMSILEEYRASFPEKVKIFQLNPSGISSAMNKGIVCSGGEYLIHLHSDDSFFDNMVLFDVNDFLNKKQNPDWIYGKISVFNKFLSKGTWPDNNIWHKNNFYNNFYNYILKFYNYIPHQAVFIKKKIFYSLGFFSENLKSNMDIEFWLRIRKNTKWFYFDRVISNFCLRSDAQSSAFINKKNNNRELNFVKKKYLNKFEFLIFIFFNFFINIKNKNIQK